MGIITSKWSQLVEWRHKRKLNQLDADVDVEEARVAKKIKALKDQSAMCTRRVEEIINRCADEDRDPELEEIIEVEKFERRKRNHQAEFVNNDLMLQNCTLMRDEIDKHRNSSEQHSIVMSNLTSKLMRMRKNPAEAIKATAKRNEQTVKGVEQLREGSDEVDEGTITLNFALSSKAELELQAADVTPRDSVKARFAAARMRKLEMGMCDLGVSPLSPMKSPTKKKGGKQYDQLSPDHAEMMAL